MAPTTSSSTVPVSTGVKFVSAGLAGCIADLVTFPLDTAKVRLQVQGEVAAPGGRNHANSGTAAVPAANRFKYRGILRTVYVISSEEGVAALYNGLVAGLQRQVCFASIRIGFYDTVKQKYISALYGDGETGAATGSHVGLRILAGITTGAIAVSCAQPTDVVKVRMQAAQSGGRYAGCIDAYRTIAVQEGVRGLWKGVLPNIARNATVNAAELVSYDLIKESILRHQLMSDNWPCHFVSAFGAGFCTTCVASPVDVVKTRYMNSPAGIYRGAIHCAAIMYSERGLLTFYKGFMPSFVRLGSWNIAMFVTFEQLKRLFSGNFA